MMTIEEFDAQIAALEAACPESEEEVEQVANDCSALYRQIGLIAWSYTAHAWKREALRRLAARRDSFGLLYFGISDEDCVRYGYPYLPWSSKASGRP